MTNQDPMSETHDCAGEAAAYVLGALEPHEAAAFELHLERCAVCQEETEALGGVVRALPMATPQYRAPRRLRRRVRRAVRNGSPALERSRRVNRMTAAFGGSLAAVAAGAFAVVSIGGSGLSATVVQASVSGISGSAQLKVARGHGELLVKHLTAPGKGNVYEVWLERGHAAPVPASVLFSVGSNGDADVGLPGDLRGVSAVLVTSEPLGGTPKPTHSPVIVAKLV